MKPLEAVAEVQQARGRLPEEARAVWDKAKIDDPAHLVATEQGSVIALTFPVTVYDRNDTPLIDDWGCIAVRRGSGNYIFHTVTKMKHATLNRLAGALETQSVIDSMRG